MNFETQIQQWVSFDNQLKNINDKARELREKRAILSKSIIDHASSNKLTDKVIQISDGKLKFTNTKVNEPLTYKFLEKTLGEIIKNDAHVKHILEQLKERRSVNMVPEIKRFPNN